MDGLFLFVWAVAILCGDKFVAASALRPSADALHAAHERRELHNFTAGAQVGSATPVVSADARRVIPISRNAAASMAMCMAMQQFLRHLRRKIHRFRNYHITIFSSDEILVRIVNNVRQRDERHDLLQFDTKKLFDKARTELHRDLFFAHHYADKHAKLPWVRWANKLASREDLGVLRDYAVGNFPLTASSIPHITSVVQQSAANFAAAAAPVH